MSETLNLISGHLLSLFFSFGYPHWYKNLNGCVITAFKTIADDDLFNILDEMNEEIVHMTSEDISPKNDLEDNNLTDSFDEPQNQELVPVLLPKRGSTFKLNKMNLLANIKVFTVKCYNLESSENIIGELDAGIN